MSYQYSLTYNNLQSLTKLNVYLKENLSEYVFANYTQPTLDIFVNSVINDISQLETLLTNYSNDPDDIAYDKFVISSIAITSDVTTWYTTHSWIEDNNRVLKKVELESYLQPSTSSDMASQNFIYQIRLVDLNHNFVLGSFSSSNHQLSLNTINVTNFPSNVCSVELQMKKGLVGDSIYVKNITAYYD